MGETSKSFDKKLQIDDKVYIITRGDGFFSFLHPIKPRDAIFLIRLEDEAGNSVKLKFNFYFKLQKPICTINEPKEHDWVINSTLPVKGQAEPGSIIKLLNRETKADESGYFQLEETLSEVGFQSIKLTVVDLFGNQAEYTVSIWFGFSIQMQINSLNAMNNNKKRKLDLAPFIRAERTMVPFRFLGEELQAKISFEIDPVTKLVSTIQYELNGKTVQLTIGKKEGIVDGEIVLLDTFPVIIKGRTVVPLRFISENLGCKTVWEPTTKSILVQYAQKS
jgi:hypothetical protein